ncbi:MAG: glycosyltransferase [Coriobacteriia bacterium]|nr:glycosyltransferase [Coriobacteriia bacterium]
MRIGLFSDTYTPEINGVVSSMLMLREGLEARGHEVWIFAPTNPLNDEIDDHIIRISSLPLVLLPERRVATPLELGIMRKIRSLNLDIIHTQTEFGVGSYGFRAARRYHIPHIHTSHTTWEEYTHYVTRGMFDGTAKNAVRIYTKVIFDRCTRIVAPTVKTKELLLSYKVAVPIDVVPTGVDLIRFFPANTSSAPHTGGGDPLAKLKHRLGTDRFEHTILSLGRIAPEKSIVELFDLMTPYLKAHSDACFLVVGDGPSRSDLEHLAKKRCLVEQIIFTGELPWDRIPNYYRIADVLVGNSHSETQGLTFIEAIASGVPLVVRYNTCFDGILENGVSGTLFTENGEFEPALHAILTDHELRVARIRAGIEAAATVSKDRFIEDIETVYEKARP